MLVSYWTHSYLKIIIQMTDQTCRRTSVKISQRDENDDYRLQWISNLNYSPYAKLFKFKFEFIANVALYYINIFARSKVRTLPVNDSFLI